MSYNCDMETTEQKIADAAIYIFNNDPSATLEIIAQKANVTTRTLYRYFKDRTVLLEFCRKQMSASCKAAMNAAFDASSDPLKQLELTLYAGIACGSKYAFFDKLNQQPEHQQRHPAKIDEEYEQIHKKWIAMIVNLQKQEIVTSQLTPAWIYQLFSGMITTALQALSSGNIAQNNINEFAWFSFSRSIGINVQIITGKKAHVKR
jgi:AcrR family transcriptional regulator